MEKQQVNQQMPQPFLSIAPMIDVTYTHFRYLMRLITKKATLYTQMFHHGAVINNHLHLLPFNKIQHPIVLQLGGCNPKLLAQAALIGQKYGYDEINLNVGCPSPRVQQGSFGACLMKQPQLVLQCMQQMAKAVKVPVTVKCRLGIDQFQDYQFVKNFVKIVSNNQQGSVKHFIIHARKAYLKGLNPAQNRNIPPLQYQKVFQLQKDFPKLKFTINGGIKTLKKAKQLIQKQNLYGVMVGRTAYQNTYQLIDSDQILYNEKAMNDQQKSRKYILNKYADYVQKLQKGQIFDEQGNPIICNCNSQLLKPILTMYQGQRGCAKYRQTLSDHSKVKLRPLPEVIRQAANFMEEMKKQSIKIQEQKKKRNEQKLQNELQKMKINDQQQDKRQDQKQGQKQDQKQDQKQYQNVRSNFE